MAEIGDLLWRLTNSVWKRGEGIHLEWGYFRVVKGGQIEKASRSNETFHLRESFMTNGIPAVAEVRDAQGNLVAPALPAVPPAHTPAQRQAFADFLRDEFAWLQANAGDSRLGFGGLDPEATEEV